MTDFVQKVERRAAELFQRRQRIVVGVSGGVDSMVLLHLLHQFSRKQYWRLAVAHLNHQLRGTDADADEQLVQQVAGELGLPVFTERIDVRTVAKKEKYSIEMAARIVRHNFLARVAKEQKTNAIALAHHADDQTELFFLRLFRGAGSEGLAGMKPVSPAPFDDGIKLVRPLLGFNREQIVEHARREKIRFHEDSTNASTDMLRNRIRHKLLPLIERSYQPAIREIITRTMDLLGAESECARESAIQWLTKGGPKFDTLPVAVQRHVLQLQLLRESILPEFALVEHLRCRPDEPRTTAFGKIVARNTQGWLDIMPDLQFDFLDTDTNDLELDLRSDSGSIYFDGVNVSWFIRAEGSPPLPANIAGLERFDADSVGASSLLRHWQKGDRFQPIGMSKPVKLQDLFANLKVPRTERHQRVVAIAEKGEIFWVEGLRISEKFKLTAQTRRVLEWRWRR